MVPFAVLNISAVYDSSRNAAKCNWILVTLLSTTLHFPAGGTAGDGRWLEGRVWWYHCQASISCWPRMLPSLSLSPRFSKDQSKGWKHKEIKATSYLLWAWHNLKSEKEEGAQSCIWISIPKACHAPKGWDGKIGWDAEERELAQKVSVNQKGKWRGGM